MIKTIVLDLDGPLLDGMYRHYECYSDILKEHGLSPIQVHQYWEMKRNRMDRKQLLALSDSLDLYDIFLAAWIKKIESKKYLELDRLQVGVVDILSDWKKSGMRLVLATMRNNLIHLNWQLRKLKIAHFFDAVVVVGSDASKSTEVKPLLNNASLEEVIWIGDTEIDVHAAQDLGVKICALSSGLRTEEYLSSLYPDFLEKDLSAFAKRVLKVC